MGKKKPQKTKELSVAIAEASTTTTGEEIQQRETARKRGRPRKIIEIEKTEIEDKKGEPAAEGHAQSPEEAIGSEAKKLKTSEEEKIQEEQHVEAEGPSAYTRGKRKEIEGKSVEKEPPRRSRRRKSEPRKSS